MQTSAPGTSFHGDRILQNEDNWVSQSPDAMSTDIFSDMPPLEGSNAASNEDEIYQTTDAEPSRDQDENRQFSRSNTLFSRPSSPETSPPTSPRVRASLIHQNSDIITMHLELLGTAVHMVKDRQAFDPGTPRRGPSRSQISHGIPRLSSVQHGPESGRDSE